MLLIPHMDAGDRDSWEGDQDLRPLSELGWRQAQALATALVERDPDLYSSPALRARQSLDPLSRLLPYGELIDWRLAEKQPGEDRHAMAERAWEAIREIIERYGGDTIAVASHGDLIPALADYLAAEYHLGGVPDITRRGHWYEIQIEDGRAVSITLNGGPEDFPLV